MHIQYQRNNQMLCFLTLKAAHEFRRDCGLMVCDIPTQDVCLTCNGFTCPATACNIGNSTRRLSTGAA